MGFLVPLGMALAPAIGSMFGAGAATAGAAAASSLATGAISTGLSVAGGVLQGVNAYQQGMFQSKLATYNSQLASNEKNQTLVAGSNAESLQKMNTGKLVGAELANQGASGTDVGGGSNESSRTSTKIAGDYDAATVRYNAARQAYGLGQQAWMDTLQAKADKQGAIGGLVGGIFSAGSSFLSGASSLTDKWLQYQTSGALQVPGGSSQPIDMMLNTQG